MTTRDVSNDLLLRQFHTKKDSFAKRAANAKAWVELYQQRDKLEEQGYESIATSDARVALDLATHILSRYDHIDRIPWSTQDETQKRLQNMGERFLSGNWRLVNERELLRGNSWHQRRLASWMLITGWYAMYVGMEPDSKGFPRPMADFYDPTNVYPSWGGLDGMMDTVDHEYAITLGALRAMGGRNGWDISGLLGEGSQLIYVLDHWESRYNPSKPEQPDILNTVYHSISNQSPTGLMGSHPQQSSTQGWSLLQPMTNKAAGSDGNGKDGGFLTIPILVGPVPGIEVPSAYTTADKDILGLRGSGLLATLKVTQDAINRYLTYLMQEERDAVVAGSTIITRSPGGTEVMGANDLGQFTSLPDDTSVDMPLVKDTKLGAKSLILNALETRFQREAFSWTLLGQTSFQLSGVAIERLNEWARSRVGPFQRFMEHIYGYVSQQWLKEYRRRWQGRTRSVRLTGQDLGGSYFDEEFTARDIPDVFWVKSEIPLALPEDDMMKANIARALNPDLRMSPDWIREKVMKVQDIQQEAQLAAAGRRESDPFWINVQIAKQLTGEILSAREQRTDAGNLEAELLTFALQQLMTSLVPQGRPGNAERPNQGFPEAGGVRSNAGGGEPSLSPENRVTEPPVGVNP